MDENRFKAALHKTAMRSLVETALLRLSMVLLLVLGGCTRPVPDKTSEIVDAEAVLPGGNPVSIITKEGRFMGQGFWLMVDERPAFVTARHVADREFKADVGDRTRIDMMVLDIPYTGEATLVPSTLALPREPKDEFESGYPEFPVKALYYDAQAMRFKTGLVSAYFECGSTILTTVPVKPGMSGSPLLDAEGRCLGLCTTVMTPKEGGHVRSAYLSVNLIVAVIRAQRTPAKPGKTMYQTADARGERHARANGRTFE